jgi:hypothetical protein
MQNEIWLPIKGYEGLYECSSLGRIKSLPRIASNNQPFPGGIRKQFIDPRPGYGYLNVGLNINGKKRSKCVHRIIAIAFLGLPSMSLDVNHINGIKTDNRIENLEWLSRSENIKHSFKLGLSKIHGMYSRNKKLNTEKVAEIRQKYLPRKYSFRMLGREYGVSEATIRQIVNMESWV